MFQIALTPSEALANIFLRYQQENSTLFRDSLFLFDAVPEALEKIETSEQGKEAL